MSTGTTVVIVVIAIIVIGAVAAVVMSATRRRRLQQRFGPEYDRLVEKHYSRRKAEAELAQRERRVNKLDIKPLDPATRERYTQEWAAIQERFVDAPQGAVTQARYLVVAVMNDRGYPTDDQQQMLADLSVDHAAFVDHYRSAVAISERNSAGTSSTEELRQAMIHYRALCKDLLGEPADTGLANAEPVNAEPVNAEPVAAEPAAAEPTVAAEPAAGPAVATEPVATEPVDTEPLAEDEAVTAADVPPADTGAAPAGTGAAPENIPDEHPSAIDSIRRGIKR